MALCCIQREKPCIYSIQLDVSLTALLKVLNGKKLIEQFFSALYVITNI